MRITNRHLVASAVAATAVLATSVEKARAAFTLSLSGPTAITTGTNAGDVYYNLSAINNGNTGGNSTGTQLLAFDTTAAITSATGNIVFQLTDLDGDGSPDANVFGNGITATSGLGSYMRIGGATSFNATSVNPSPYTTDPTGATDANGNNIPTQSINTNYTNGTVTSFEIAGQLLPSGVSDTSAVIFSHIVVPATAAGTIAGQLGGTTGSAQSFSLTFSATATPTSTPLISLTAAAPTGYGSQVGTLAVNGSNGSYRVATAAFTSTNAGYVAVSGFNPGTDREVYGLSILENGATPSAADLATLVADINATSGAAGTGSTSTNGTVTASAITSPFNNLFPAGTDLELTVTGATSGTPFLGFNLSTAAGITGTLTVSGAAAVPEPTTVAFAAVTVGGLLVGRRRRRA